MTLSFMRVCLRLKFATEALCPSAKAAFDTREWSEQMYMMERSTSTSGPKVSWQKCLSRTQRPSPHQIATSAYCWKTSCSAIIQSVLFPGFRFLLKEAPRPYVSQLTQDRPNLAKPPNGKHGIAKAPTRFWVIR